MGLREARSVVAGDGVFVEWEEEPYRAARDRWLRIVSRYADVVEPTDQHEAYADLSGHPRPREAADRLQESLRAALPCSVHVGLGACRWVSHFISFTAVLALVFFRGAGEIRHEWQVFLIGELHPSTQATDRV